MAVVMYMQSDEESIQVVKLKRLSAETEQLTIKGVMSSEISQVVENLQEKDKEVASSLEETKRSLQTVEDQMQKLKSKHEKLVKKIERKNSHEQWLKKEKNARSGEDYCVMQDMIAETEKAVAELSEKIIDLEKEIDAFRHKKKVINEKLLKQKDDKKQLEIELGKKQEELESVKKETEIQKKHLEEKIDQLRCELCEKKVKFHSINNYNFSYS